jgi:hypothetical protein
MIGTNWTDAIGEMISVRRRMKDVDRRGLWGYSPPEPPATEDRIERAESAIGERLPDEYRGFLQHAAGWMGIYQRVDLFGPEDLYRGERFDSGKNAVLRLEDSVLAVNGYRRNQLVPIALSRDDLDLFVLIAGHHKDSGKIAWFAGAQVDLFGGFVDMFSSLLGYNRVEVDELAKN